MAADMTVGLVVSTHTGALGKISGEENEKKSVKKKQREVGAV
jgi:hypothetical protein